MKVYTQATIEVAGHDVPKDTFMDISEALLPSLAGKVAYLADGGLRTSRNVDDLEALIVGLTADDLALQRLLLMRYCEAFDQNHIGGRWNAWELNTAAMVLNEGMVREEAELEAARDLNLLAFLEEYRLGKARR
ncbi:hypothetical protein RW64_09345 [Geobacter sulfurreducens]|nr:hypothetical protein RW64_09345 [Geobacter sulfurreducens]